MESCHSVIPKLPPIVTRVPHPPNYRRLPPKIYSTLQHLLQIFEELHSKEELSKVLQDLADCGDGVDPANSQGSPIVVDPDTIIRVSRILRKLNSSGKVTMATNKTGTEVASSATLKTDSEEPQGQCRADLEVALRAKEGQKMSLSQQDNLYLVKKMKEFDQRVKPLKEKNKKFLEKNVELTTQNRKLKDQIHSVNDENKKLRACMEEYQCKCSQLTQELETERVEKGRLEEQVLEIGKLRAEIGEKNKLVASLRQTCVEKERRMEVLQHRKKRRLRMSPTEISRISSPSSLIDDDCSINSELSTSSVSAGSLSDDENIEELPNDDVEKNYKSLMKEHLTLQKSMMKLQGMLGCRTDPQRYIKMKTDYETDLFVAHYKIENLETCLEQYKVDNFSWVTEKDELVAEKNCLLTEKHVLHNKVLELSKIEVDQKEEIARLSGLYDESQEQIENLEFMLLEAQHNDTDTEKTDAAATCDVSTATDGDTRGDNSDAVSKDHNQFSLCQEIEELRCNETSLRDQLEMSNQLQKQYRETIAGLESRLTQLLDGRASEVDSVVSQLKQAEQHVVDLEDSMTELQDKVVTLQREKSGLAERLAAYKLKLDSQEQSLSLTRDEREELLQVKPKAAGLSLTPRLKLAEKGYENTRSLDRADKRKFKPERTSTPTKAYALAETIEQQDDLSELSELREESMGISNFELPDDLSSKLGTAKTSGRSDENFDKPTGHKKQRTKSEPAIEVSGAAFITMKTSLEHEVNKLQRKIAELQDENDVLKFELTQNCRGDSFESGSTSEDPRHVELCETIETLQERLHSEEATERQYKDKLKLAEKTINELEASEQVLRDRLEEGNADCEKLKKQIMRLQKKIKELKDIGTERDTVENALRDKVKFLEDTEASLTQKITELEGNNQELQQRLDLKEELVADGQLAEYFKERAAKLESENHELNSKVIDLEEANEILSENWKKVADEEANRREQLEENIRVLKCANKELKSKLKDKESEIDLNASGQSLATEINEQTIQQLEERIKELENELQKTTEEKNEKIACLREEFDNLKENELRLGETLVEMENNEKVLKSQISLLEKSENSDVAICRMISYEGKLNQLKSSEENLLDRLDSMEDNEDNLKKRIVEMEKIHEEKVSALQKELVELKQTEIDLLAKIKSYEDNEIVLNKRIEELEDSETNLTISFSKRVADLESKEEQLQDEYKAKLEELENKEDELINVIEKLQHESYELTDKIETLESKEDEQHVLLEKLKKENVYLLNQVHDLETENEDLCNKVLELEKHEEELMEKVKGFENNDTPHEQENSDLVQSNTKNPNAKIELANKVENFVSIEKEVYESFMDIEKEVHETLKAENVDVPLPTDVKSLINENVTLKKEITELNDRLKEIESNAEKEQKLLTGRLKKQEKKLKKTQRTDSVDDYDTIAREVVTYKLEVESLRAENNELHERIMDLDESEKSLLEKQEQLQSELQNFDRLKEKLNILQDAEGKFMERIIELESVEIELREKLSNQINKCTCSGDCKPLGDNASKSADNEIELKNKISLLLDGESKWMEKVNELEENESKLKQEILTLKSAGLDNVDGTNNSSVRQPSVDSAYGSVKDNVKCELCDKCIGTDDFMEGVMGNQEQGKPVSSMFVRIQALEAENQELSTKLSSLTATDNQVRQLSEKVKSLEETEDSLMERVMELEEEEDRLNRELKKAQLAARSATDLEEELTELQEQEKEMSSTIEVLEKEKLSLKNSLGSSETEKADFAVRLATLQKQYEDEKKKVESLLKGEERWMKSVASEKKAMKELEQELQSTQEKLEELQTEYESKLSEKESNEKLLKDELNKHVRDKEYMKKKLQEYETSNNELEDEIAACKISESRMFHRHQMLMTQNQELESKLAKLDPELLKSKLNAEDSVDGSGKQSVISTVMSDNPEVISENPLTKSVFSEPELKALRNEEGDSDLLGSVPLDMLRKMKEFDQRETNYQAKIEELENKNVKLVRKLKVIMNKEKDLKHEIKDLQIELLNYRESTSSLRASTSSLDFDRSSLEDGIDSDSQSLEALDTINSDVFSSSNKVDSQYNDMTRDQLLLTVKLFVQKQKQESERMSQLEGKINFLTEAIISVTAMISEDQLDNFVSCVETFTERLQTQPDIEEVGETLMQLVETISSLRHKLETLAGTETELMRETLTPESVQKLGEVEDEVNEISGADETDDKYSPTTDSTLNISSIDSEIEEKQTVEVAVECNIDDTLEPRVVTPRVPQLETSKTISIDVPPLPHPGLSYLGQSETIRVDVEPTETFLDRLEEEDYTATSRMMDKAEDVLRQRIRELEKLEKHLKQQVLDMEQDRDELHEIARKDKAIIHEQNVLIRELQLAERSLQMQLKNFEASENSLYARLDELESTNEQLMDKIRHLEILEERLKNLVKQYKLDEKILVTKSETLENSVQEMSAKEENLKQKVQNLESEKFAFSERSEYLQLRLKELENAEADLAQRTKNQENVVQSLQSTVHELEIFGANAQARIVELEALNKDLTQRLHHSMTENSPLSHHASDMEQRVNSMEHELKALRDSDNRLRQENRELQKSEQSLQNELKALQMKEIDMNSTVRQLTESETVLKDKVAKMQRNENTLKFRVQELENSGIHVLDQSGREGNFKLPRTLEECQRKIIALQASNAELQSRVQHNVSVPNGTIHEADNLELRTVQGKMYKQPLSGEDVSSRQSLHRDASGVEALIEPTQQVVEESMVKTQTGSTQSKPSGNMMSREHLLNDLMSALEAPGTGRPEDQHWKEIETRLESSRGSEWINVGKATSLYAADKKHNDNLSHRRDEELELGIALPSESESQYYSQNDTDLHGYRNIAPASTQLPGRQAYAQSLHRSPGEVHAPPPHSPRSPQGPMVTDSFGRVMHVQDSQSVGESVGDSGRGTASVSIAASGMTLRERIAHIERQLSARESDSAREFNTELDLTSWKAKVHESNRRLEVTEKENKYFKDEINKLEKELEEKTRLFRLLEAFLDVVENILKDKNLKTEKQMIDKIENEVSRVRAELMEGGHRPDDISKDTGALTTELAKKDRELMAKRNEVDSLMQELRQWQQECRTIEDMRSNALDSLQLLEGEVVHLQDADKQLKQLKDEYNTLRGQFTKLVKAYKKWEHIRQQLEDMTGQKNNLDLENKGLSSKVKELEDKLQVLKGVTDDNKRLQDKLGDLEVKIEEYEKLGMEHTVLQKNHKGTTDLLNERTKKIEQLTEEVIELRRQAQQKDKENYQLKQGKLEDSKKTKQLNVENRKASKIRGGEPGQAIPQSTEGMLRAKIVQLKNACNEKENLIKRLQQELQRLQSGGHLSSRDFNHNQLGRSFSQDSSFDSSDPMAHLSDTELLRDSSPRHTPRPKSADMFSSPHRNVTHRCSYNNLPHYSGHSARHRGHNPALTNAHRSYSGPLSTSGFRPDLNRMPKNPHFVAIADYDPSVFSQSGRQRLELSLKEGDKVLVTGPYDQYGYYEAEVNGQVGLVPASYLQPLLHQRSGNRQNVPSYLDASPEKIAQLYNSLQQAHTTDSHGLVNGIPHGSTELPGTRRYNPQAGPPSTSTNFHVEKIIGNSSLKLSWQPVTLDNDGCSNGVKVIGYRIYKDAKAIIHPRGANVSKAVLEHLDIHAHHRLGIETVSADGQVSELSEILYEGVEEVTSEENSDTESEMDLHTVIDENEYKHGARRMFMAIYDYDPVKNSPQDHPNSELQFTAGDVIAVYGRQRPDGFYHGEINGSRGLVPAFFIEEMPQAPPRTKKAASRHKSSHREVKEMEENTTTNNNNNR